MSLSRNCAPRPIRNLALLGALALPCLALASCQDVNRAFGFDRQSPDEFTVTTRAPLAMPADENLPPPTPGAPRPQEQAPRTQALEAIAPDVALQGMAGADSAGQAALVAGASDSAARPARGEISGGGGLVSGLAFWKGRNPNLLVDADAESRRLREAAANGAAPTAGATRAVAPP